MVAGLTLPLAFAPFHWFPLAVVAPAILFASWRHATPGRAAWRGFLFGFGLFGVGVSWVYVSLHDFGNMPPPLAAFAVVLFVAWLAAYPAVLGYVQARFFGSRNGILGVLVVPGSWVSLEWVRSWLLSGFPWLHLGYTQIDTPLAGYAPWLGVYGVSFAVALSAGLLVQAWHDRRRIGTLYLPLLVAVWLGGWLAEKVEWVHPAGETLHVALVQGNVPLRIKWVPEYRQSIIERYLQLSETAPPSQLIVWPEGAVPGYLDEVGRELLPRLARLRKERSADFLFGVVEKDETKGTYYNSVVSVANVNGFYRKQHLVPFGEFLPLKPVLNWLINYLHIPMSDFSAGAPEQPPLTVAGQRIGVSICYEDAFGEEVIRALPAATLLVNVSEDAWFGDSLAPHQRLQMARMRAIESGRPMLRAANTGPSVVIDHRGTVTARSPQFKTFVLPARVRPMQGVTPYVRLGNWPIVSALFVIILGSWLWLRRARSVNEDKV